MALPPTEPTHSQAISALEQERRRIAALLAAQVGDPLSMLVAQANAYEQLLGGNPEARRVANLLAGLARRLLDDVRNLEATLYPAPLDALGLIPALEALADRITRQHGVNVRLRASRLPARPAAAPELALYRVAQTALESAAGGAGWLALDLHTGEGELSLTVTGHTARPALDGAPFLDALACLHDLGGRLTRDTRPPGPFEIQAVVTLHPPASLTPREQDVLRLVAQGLSDREIGETLGISPRTVNFHLGNVYGKLGVTSRTEAAILALRGSLPP